MPSKRSPSQRTPEGRRGRQVAALLAGTNAGRLISASRRSNTVPSSTSPASGDSTHPGTGTDSTAVGDGATASSDYTTSLGVDATAEGGGGTAVGHGSRADVEGVAVGDNAHSGQYNVAVGADAGPTVGDDAYSSGGSTSVGYAARAGGAGSTALGTSSHAGGARSVAIGESASAPNDDQSVLAGNSLELVQTSGSAATSLILRDGSGGRWAVTVDSTGHLTTTAL